MNPRWNQSISRQVILTMLVISLLSVGNAAMASDWRIVSTDGRWQLLQDVKPFYIQGAVAPNRFDILKACGGNSARTNASKASLDAAQQAGLAAMTNLPVRAQRSGMDWSNPRQVAEQKTRILQIVTALKDHPAVMFWAVGNELDHIPGNKPYDRKLWACLNEIAIAIKQIDPHHPVLTVVGTGQYETKIQEIAAACKDMDLLGINAYGDIAKAAELTRKHWPKPYVVSEWGPTGHWEVPKTKWRVPIEQTSSEKAKVIADRYTTVILADRTNCLGSFVFYWSEKQETTHTWYGLFCSGQRTESIDVMQHFWTGAWPAKRAPSIESLAIEGFSDPRAVYLKAGKSYRASVKAADPDSDPLNFAWNIRPEVEIPPGSYAGGGERPARQIEGLIANASLARIEFTAPAKAGPYRLFLTINDDKGHIAYGNIPFFVEE